ncbi:hypothetical protein EV121DRAFT_290699 [Schizophyllum commune]
MSLSHTYSLALVPFRLHSGFQILLLSGVGPAEHPSEHDISIVRDLPAIGNRLVDRPIVDLHFDRKKNDSLKYFLPSRASEVFQLLSIAVRYALSGDGPMATNMGNQHIRVDDPKLLSDAKEKLGDALPAKGHRTLSTFCNTVGVQAARQGDVHTYGVHCYLLRPRSTGSIRLQSADPWAYPVVIPDPREVHTLRRGVRLLLRVALTSPVADALDGD